MAAPEAQIDANVAQLALRMGDTCLILAQRNGEWCGHAPVLEEDIAMANMALDLLGQANLWLELAAESEGKGRTPDELAFLRDGWDFRNLLLVEQPNGDYAHTVTRQYLFDAWHLPMLKALASSAHPRVAEIAAKASREVAYHLERSRDLVVSLGDGTDESHTRMQSALTTLWPFTAEFAASDAADAELAAKGISPEPATIYAKWRAEVEATLVRATLTIPTDAITRTGGRDGRHSEHLGYILAEMQFLQRAYPGATW